MQMLKWIWRGLVTRLAMMARLIPPPPHRRDPKVSEHFQVEPPEQHVGPPPPHGVQPRGHADEPEMQPQQHVHPFPDDTRANPKR